MRSRRALLLMLALFAGGAGRVLAQADPPQAKPHPLAPAAWMAERWAAEAKEPGSDRPPAKVLSHFTPQVNGCTMTIETSFDGKLVYEGMFAFDPALKAIGFWYVTVEGESIKGTVEPKETGDLLFDLK